MRFKAAKMDPMLYQDVWGRPSVSLCLAWDEGGQRLTVLQTRLRFSQSFIKACISGARSLRSRSCFLTTPPQSRCNRLISGRPRPVRVGGEDAGSYLVAFCMHLSPSDNYLKSIKPSPVFVFGFCVCVCVCVCAGDIPTSTLIFLQGVCHGWRLPTVSVCPSMIINRALFHSQKNSWFAR